MTTPKIHFGPASLGEMPNFSNLLSINVYFLDDANDKIGQVFIAPKTGIITDVGFMHEASVGSPPDYQVSIETVTTGRFPSGTPFGGSVATSFTPGTPGWRWITLSTPASVTIGDVFSAVVGPTGVAPNGSNYIRVCDHAIGQGYLQTFSYFSSLWRREGSWGDVAVRYSDGEIVGLIFDSINVVGKIDANTTPDEVGGVFTVPLNCTLTGFSTPQQHTLHNTTARVRLYDADDVVLMERDIKAGEMLWDLFSVVVPEVPLLAETPYRISFAPLTTTDIRPVGLKVFNLSEKALFPNGDRFTWTSRTNGGAWTDVELQFPYMGLWLKDLSL